MGEVREGRAGVRALPGGVDREEAPHNRHLNG